MVNLVMSAIHFMSNPFPDNHDGFDYSPQSESDSHREQDKLVSQARNAQAEKKMLSMLGSIFK